jgi:hypothetical protein
MTRAERTIRIISSAAAATIAVLFVLAYSGIKFHNNVEHIRSALPSGTAFLVAAAPWAVLAPLAALTSGMLLSKRDVAITVISNAAWLFSLAWPLACILAWEIPFILL